MRLNFQTGTIPLNLPQEVDHQLNLPTMPNQITFQRPNAGRIQLFADVDGLMITCAWSVLIKRATILEYLRKVDSDPNAGFFNTTEGGVALAHGAARITFSREEFITIQKFVQQVYPPN